MTHNYSLRSRGPASYTEAINRNLIELSTPADLDDRNRIENRAEQDQNNGISPEDSNPDDKSSQTNPREDFNEDANQSPGQREPCQQGISQDLTQVQHASSQTDGASHSDLDHINANLNTSETELQVLRVQNAQYEEKIKILTQKLNTNEDIMQKMNGQMAKLVIESRQRAIPKLPIFSGSADENIEVWITQFDESLQFLNDAEKLQEMLPKFRGTAADFVFGQLTYAERSDYQTLLSQLELRFKMIETPRMFQIQLENRKQRVGESYHDFACELKRLYEKAYPRRPWKVRDEDLVRKFMNCILDREAGAQVEYHQCPKTIDHAVYEVVRYTELLGRPKPITQSN